MEIPKTIFSRLVNYFSGRHTIFVVWFALSAFVLALFGKLTGPYVGMCSALQTAVLVHSAKEDWFTWLQKNKRDDSGNPGG